MVITAGAVFKSTAVIAGTGAAITGIYYLHKFFSGALSKYEYSFISFLYDEDNDIIFDVKKEDGKSDLTEGDISFTSGDSKTISVSAKVQLTSGNSSSFKSKGSDTTDPQIIQMKSWNGGNWTWECALEFKKEGEANEINSKYKDLIFKGSDKGLLGILKTDISKYNESSNDLTKEDLRKIKTIFITGCGLKRGLEKNRKINSGNLKDLKVTINTFEFVKKESENQLSPKDEEKFLNWFKFVNKNPNQ